MKTADKKTIAEHLKKYITYFTVEEIENLIEIPPPGIKYSYAFPTFRLSKFEKKDPKSIAKDLEKKLEPADFLAETKAEGPYLNFQINSRLILENVFKLERDCGRIRYALNKKALKPLNVVIEYPSPNTNKPLHLGHVRNLLIGKSLSNLLEYKGDKVFQVNLNNDRGIHICKSMVGYDRWFKGKEPDIKSDHFVGLSYVKYSMNEDDQLKGEAETYLRKWEQNDPETIALWKKMNKWALDGFRETYEKFEISFDKEYFESNFYMKGKEKILEGYKKGIFKKGEDGAIVARLQESTGLPDKVLLRSDGTSIYITQDIYLAYLKKQDFNYDKSIYVVGNEQDLYFKQLFVVLDLLGFKEDKYHLSYGMINLPEGKMKSREGTVVDADNIVDDMINLAFEEVNKRYPWLSEEEKRNRAKVIGMAALKFFILKYNPKYDFVFNPKESLSFEGETGPYIQYCYARIHSIINKSKEEINLNVNFDLINHEKEIILINQLIYFPETVDAAIKSYGIHLIPQYLLSLGQAFNSFYSECQVISENKELERARLLLIKCVQIVIKVGLNLLSIEALDEM